MTRERNQREGKWDTEGRQADRGKGGRQAGRQAEGRKIKQYSLGKLEPCSDARLIFLRVVERWKADVRLSFVRVQQMVGLEQNGIDAEYWHEIFQMDSFGEVLARRDKLSERSERPPHRQPHCRG